MIKAALLIAVLGVATLPAIAEIAARISALALRQTQNESRARIQADSGPAVASPCNVAGKREFAISCDYELLPATAQTSEDEPRIALLHATLSFKTNTDNWLRAQLSFTNSGKTRVSEGRSVYLAFDDDSGRNFIRRLLPTVDFQSLPPGERRVFPERLLIPALQPGHYLIHLWIPSSDPTQKYDPAHNFLLDNLGIADRKSGLNTLASIEVRR